MGKSEPRIQINIPNVGKREDIINIFSDSQAYDDEMTDIVTRNNASFDSTCTDNQGSLETDWSNLNLLADICVNALSCEVLGNDWENGTCLEGMGLIGPPGEFTSSEGHIGYGEGLYCGEITLPSERLDEELRRDHGVEHECDLKCFHELGTTSEDMDNSGRNTLSNVTSEGDIEGYCENHGEITLPSEKLDEELSQDHGVEHECDLKGLHELGTTNEGMDNSGRNIQSNVRREGDTKWYCENHGEITLPSEKLDEELRQDHGVEHECDLKGYHELGTTNEDMDNSGRNIQSNVTSEGDTEWYCGNHGEITLPSEKLDEELSQDHGVEHECDLKGFHELGTTNEDMDNSGRNIQSNITSEGDTEEDVDISSDSEGYCQERSDIAIKKNDFFSSGTLAATDQKELNICVKCNKRGKLLVCSSNSCPLVIHERCLNSDASFDTRGNFYCPFCAYSRAISKCMGIKKKVWSTRTDFATFICWAPGEEPRKQSPGSNRIREHNLKQFDDSCRSTELQNKDIEKNASTHQHRRNLENQQAGPSTLNSTDNSSESGGAEEICEEENSARVSKYYIRVQKQKKYYLYPEIPQLRRKRIPWTTAEEEALKEGMRQYCSPNDRYIPWKKILEFGANVFQKCRSTVDLKDKWRNLCRASP